MINNDTSLMARIKQSRVDTVVATGEKFIDVEVDIYADGVVIETKKFGFPIGTPATQIQTEIKALLGNIKAEAENAIANEEAEQVEQLAQNTISELADIEQINE